MTAGCEPSGIEKFTPICALHHRPILACQLEEAKAILRSVVAYPDRPMKERAWWSIRDHARKFLGADP